MENNNIISIRVEVPGLELLAQAIMALAGQSGTLKEEKPAPQPVSPAAAPQIPAAVPTAPAIPITQTPQPIIPVAQQPIIPVAAPTAPAVPVTQTAPNQIPTTAVPVTHTMDELAVAASQLVNAGKQQRLFEILSGFGASSLMELPPEKYAAFAGCLKAEGVKF